MELKSIEMLKDTNMIVEIKRGLFRYAKKTAESHENFRQQIPKWMTN